VLKLRSRGTYVDDATDLVCYCGGVDRATIVAAIRHGASSLKDVQRMTGAGVGSRCKELNPKGVCCHSDIRAIIEAERGSHTESASASCSCCAAGED